MSVKLDNSLREKGTRFLIYPQPRTLRSFAQPEIVVISLPPDQIQPGPADNRFFVVDAINKLSYSPHFLPPYAKEKNEAVRPGPGGHFDHLEIGSRAFGCASMYAVVRRVLDIWQDYIEKPIVWHFDNDFERLELIPFLESDNSQAGYGFLELGFAQTSSGERDPYCLNFDVIAHELGHNIIYATVGEPSSSSDPGVDYDGMQEAFADMIAIICSLHFHSVVDHLLNHTKGNLFSRNEISRVGELSISREIRIAFNDKKMSNVGTGSHDRSLPLTGAIFDILVEVFQKRLVAMELISQKLADESVFDAHKGDNIDEIQQGFTNAYAGRENGFKDALLESRDYLGKLLAKAWTHMSPDFLTYHKIVRALMSADRGMGGEHLQTIRECFAWRQIAIPRDSVLLKPRSLTDCFSQKKKGKKLPRKRKNTKR